MANTVTAANVAFTFILATAFLVQMGQAGNVPVIMLPLNWPQDHGHHHNQQPQQNAEGKIFNIF
jgi:hypothetical protein